MELITIIKNTSNEIFTSKDFFEAYSKAKEYSNEGGVWFVVRDCEGSYFVVERKHYDLNFLVSTCGITQKIKDHCFVCCFAGVGIEISTLRVVSATKTGEARVKYHKKKKVVLTNSAKIQISNVRMAYEIKEDEYIKKSISLKDKLPEIIGINNILKAFDDNYSWIIKNILTNEKDTTVSIEKQKAA